LRKNRGGEVMGIAEIGIDTGERGIVFEDIVAI
jgi:hypothetical protein